MMHFINILAIFYHLCIYSCSISMMMSDTHYIMMGGLALFSFVSYQLAVTYYDHTSNDPY